MKFYNNKYHVIETREDNKYDFRLSNGYTYEVKYDAYSLKTNNIFIEISQFGKKSGLHITKAKYHIFVIPQVNNIDMFILIRTSELKAILEIYDNITLYSDKFKVGYLLPKTILLKYSIIISS
jgi:hypothetical protein